MPNSQYNYTGIYEKYGVEQRFHAPSLNNLAQQMGIAKMTIRSIAQLDGKRKPNGRVPVRIEKTLKQNNSIDFQ